MPRSSFTFLLLCLCLLAVHPALAVPAPLPGTACARLVDQPVGRERLETAILHYRGPRGVRVDLVAAIHVGDAAYYRALQKQFLHYDKLLFELVAPVDADMARAGRSDSGLSGVQRWLKDLLQLDFQLDDIDYTRPNFLHADIGIEELAANLRDNLAELLGMMVRWSVIDSVRMRRADGSLRLGGLEFLVAMGRKDRPRALKLVLARELVDLDDAMGELGAATGPGAILIARRNQVALGVLRKTLDKGARNVGIFYGAAHLPDLDAHLTRDFGLQRSGSQWLTAWDLSSPATQEK